MLTLIDNYDSFTYNLVHFIGELGVTCEVIRNDDKTVDAVLAAKPQAIIISPGPCTPNEAGICLELIRQAPDDLPILGICLGHQSIGQAFGAKIIRAAEIMHGKLSPVQHQKSDIFDGLETPLIATRYHSLVVDTDSLPDDLTISAQTESGIIMGVTHRSRPVYGIQFHPESIATQDGHKLLANFLCRAGFSVPETLPEIQFDRQRLLPQ